MQAGNLGLEREQPRCTLFLGGLRIALRRELLEQGLTLRALGVLLLLPTVSEQCCRGVIGALFVHNSKVRVGLQQHFTSMIVRLYRAGLEQGKCGVRTELENGAT